MRERLHNQKGFTLIELMATLAILALIIAIAIPAVGNLLDKSAKTADDSSIELMERAGELAHVQKLDFDEVPGEVPEDESYAISTLIQEGFLNMELDNKFNKPGNYVNKINKSGTFVYKGVGEKGDGGFGDGGGNEVVIPPETDSSLFTWERLNGSEEFGGTGPFRVTGYLGSATDIVIPRLHHGEEVHETSPGSFYGDGLTSVWLPDTLTKIGNSSFMGNALTYAYIPNSVIDIGLSSFVGNQLSEIVIPGDGVVIGMSAFSGNKLTDVTISGENAVIGMSAFMDNNISNLVFTGSLEAVGDSAFAGNNIADLVIPEGLAEVGSYAFYDNPLESVLLPNSLTVIGGSAFMDSVRDNRLPHIHIPASVTTIGESAFSIGVIIQATLGSEGERYATASEGRNPFEAVE